MSISLLWLVNKFKWVEEVLVRDAGKAFLVKTYNLIKENRKKKGTEIY